jgi:hypothetical protein
MCSKPIIEPSDPSLVIILRLDKLVLVTIAPAGAIAHLRLFFILLQPGGLQQVGLNVLSDGRRVAHTCPAQAASSTPRKTQPLPAGQSSLVQY